MKKIAFYGLLLTALFTAFSSCKEDGYVVKGVLQNAGDLQVVLEQVNFSPETQAISRVTCDKNGKFKMELQEPLKSGIYRMSVGAKRLFLMVDGTEKSIEIEGSLNTLEKMEGVTVKGSKLTDCYNDRVRELIEAAKPGTVAPPTVKGIVDKSCSPLMKAIFSMQLINNGVIDYMEDYKKISADLTNDLPDSKYAKDYAGAVDQVEKNYFRQMASAMIKIGQSAPDIELPDLNGKKRKLSDLKGKVVLLDFWASWCGPCRRENPNVVSVYNKYKDKGFTVFSVSLDGADMQRLASADEETVKSSQKLGREAWKAAIEKDGLVWESHVSELKKWNCSAAMAYGVNSIPKTFLLDREGKIVAMDTRGPKLEEELLKVL